jgi:hypothetical protein
VIAGPTFPNYGKRPITLRVMDDHRVENIVCRIEIEYFYRNSKTFGTRILSLLDGRCPRPGRCFLRPLEFHILQGRWFEFDREWKVPALNQVAVNVNRRNIPSANLNPTAAPVLQLCRMFLPG